MGTLLEKLKKIIEGRRLFTELLRGAIYTLTVVVLQLTGTLRWLRSITEPKFSATVNCIRWKDPNCAEEAVEDLVKMSKFLKEGYEEIDKVLATDPKTDGDSKAPNSARDATPGTVPPKDSNSCDLFKATLKNLHNGASDLLKRPILAETARLNRVHKVLHAESMLISGS